MTHRVLFVDDEPGMAFEIRSSFARAPYEVLTATSGAEALGLMRSKPVDVVVCDERMPNMSGSQLLARIREEFPDTVRILVSGQADISTAIQAINDAQVFRFLLKPCDPTELAASVEEAIESLEVRRRFDRWQREQATDRSDPNARLDRALQTLSMVFQPIFRIGDGSVYAFEALSRLEDPDVTNVGQLLGLAEALGRECETDLAVRRAIARRLPRAPRDANVFVNVHPATLLEGSLFADEDPLAPFADRIVLEITERSALHDSGDLLERVKTLRSMGYRIALDDLGAGYAGLTSFALLHPEVVKFDMDLVRGIHRNATRDKIVRSMVAVCNEMGIETVAEGVESGDEYGAVRAIGCTLVQGYFTGRPSARFGAGEIDDEQELAA
ncbi:MAG: EAL domain-containing protein [Planctomycetota bacterium]